MLTGCGRPPAEQTLVSKPLLTNLVHALIAVVGGNVLYFLLMPLLPPLVRHVPFRLDLGLVVDFWFCLVVFGIVKTVSGRKHGSGPPPA